MYSLRTSARLKRGMMRRFYLAPRIDAGEHRSGATAQ
jgi:hypothetical protein